jgi:hypothetical protein
MVKEKSNHKTIFLFGKAYFMNIFLIDYLTKTHLKVKSSVVKRGWNILLKIIIIIKKLTIL